MEQFLNSPTPIPLVNGGYRQKFHYKKIQVGGGSGGSGGNGNEGFNSAVGDKVVGAAHSGVSGTIPTIVNWIAPNNSIGQYFLNKAIKPLVGRIVTILFNIFWALIIFFFGGFGIFAMRIFKWQWTNQLWSYIPIFWFPYTTSWVVSIAVLLGFFD